LRIQLHLITLLVVLREFIFPNRGVTATTGGNDQRKQLITDFNSILLMLKANSLFSSKEQMLWKKAFYDPSFTTQFHN